MEHVAAGAAELNWVRFCGADDTSSSRGKGGANRLHSNLRWSCTSDCEIRCDGVMMTVGARGSVASMGVFLPSAPKSRVAPAVFISCTDSCQLCISLLFKRQAWRVQHLCLLSLLFASGAWKVLELHFKAHGLIKSRWNALWFPLVNRLADCGKCSQLQSYLSLSWQLVLLRWRLTFRICCSSGSQQVLQWNLFLRESPSACFLCPT